MEKNIVLLLIIVDLRSCISIPLLFERRERPTLCQKVTGRIDKLGTSLQNMCPKFEITSNHRIDANAKVGGINVEGSFQASGAFARNNSSSAALKSELSLGASPFKGLFNAASRKTEHKESGERADVGGIASNPFKSPENPETFDGTSKLANTKTGPLKHLLDKVLSSVELPAKPVDPAISLDALQLLKDKASSLADNITSSKLGAMFMRPVEPLTSAPVAGFASNPTNPGLPLLQPMIPALHAGLKALSPLKRFDPASSPVAGSSSNPMKLALPGLPALPALNPVDPASPAVAGSPSNSMNPGVPPSNPINQAQHAGIPALPPSNPVDPAKPQVDGSASNPMNPRVPPSNPINPAQPAAGLPAMSPFNPSDIASPPVPGSGSNPMSPGLPIPLPLNPARPFGLPSLPALNPVDPASPPVHGSPNPMNPALPAGLPALPPLNPLDPASPPAAGFPSNPMNPGLPPPLSPMRPALPAGLPELPSFNPVVPVPPQVAGSASNPMNSGLPPPNPMNPALPAVPPFNPIDTPFPAGAPLLPALPSLGLPDTSGSEEQDSSKNPFRPPLSVPGVPLQISFNKTFFDKFLPSNSSLNIPSPGAFGSLLSGKIIPPQFSFNLSTEHLQNSKALFSNISSNLKSSANALFNNSFDPSLSAKGALQNFNSSVLSKVGPPKISFDQTAKVSLPKLSVRAELSAEAVAPKVSIDPKFTNPLSIRASLSAEAVPPQISFGPSSSAKAIPPQSS